ncbi:hypothetical protein BGY98DRAFT_596675 [Russula aff. rugulosa BPL654]|nr:hypothetical protein BGY98DRAFT_596675 [Russula aff. rugulosa BPL654]
MPIWAGGVSSSLSFCSQTYLFFAILFFISCLVCIGEQVGSVLSIISIIGNIRHGTTPQLISITVDDKCTTFATLVLATGSQQYVPTLCCALQQSFYSFVQWPFIWLLGPALSHSFTTNEAQAVYASTFTLCRFRCFTIDPCDIHIPFTSFSLAWLSFATPALGLTSVSPCTRRTPLSISLLQTTDGNLV